MKRPKKPTGIAVEHWPIRKVLPYARNAREHSAAQVAMLAGAIAEFGFVNPCLVDAEGVLIAGHGRILAAQKLGLKTVPVIRLGYLTPIQADALRVADNRMSELGTWNDVLLRGTIAELKLGDFNLDLAGFDSAAVTALLAPPPGPKVSLSDRFGIVPFSVLNARDGIWQDRKQAWLALGIQSEVGRGSNLIQRSPQELFCHLTGIKYDDARRIVTEAMEREGDKFDLQALVAKHTPRARGRRPNAIPGGGTDAA